MANQLSDVISEQISDIKNTQKGNTYLDNQGQTSTLEDSKDVAKRKKELSQVDPRVIRFAPAEPY